MSDKLHRFIFDSFGIRGELVQLEHSTQAMLKNHQYPLVIADLLQQVTATCILLTSTLKFEGKMSVQLQTQDKLKLLIVQSNHKLGFRGVAHYDKRADYSAVSFKDLTQNGQLTITIEPKKGKRYQGLVSLGHSSFAACIENYFSQSEQLDTKIWLFNNDNKVCGLMLQALPDMLNQDSFDHLVYLAATLTEEESLSTEGEVLLNRLFYQENVKDLLIQKINFQCGCNRKKMLASIALLPEKEIQQILQTKQKVSVKCEFCLNAFDFNEIEIKSHGMMAGNMTQH